MFACDVVHIEWSKACRDMYSIVKIELNNRKHSAPSRTPFGTDDTEYMRNYAMNSLYLTINLRMIRIGHVQFSAMRL